MSVGRQFSLGCLSWFTFRFPCPVHQTRQDVEQWLVDNIEGPWAVGGNSGSSTIPYFIRDKDDAMLFKLTWFNDSVKPRFGR